MSKDKKEKLSWMPFYVVKFLSGTTHMSAAEVGGYILLICEQWENGPITGDIAKLKRIARVNQKQLDIILEKFEKNEKGQYYNQTCLNVKSEQTEKHKKTVDRNTANGSKKHAQNSASGKPVASQNGASGGQNKELRIKNTELIQTAVGEKAPTSPTLTHADFLDKLFTTSENSVLAAIGFQLQPRRPIIRDDAETFNASLITSGKTHKTYGEWREHFRNWLTTRPKGKDISEPGRTYKKI